MNYQLKMNRESGKKAVNPNKWILLALLLVASLAGIQAQGSASSDIKHFPLTCLNEDGYESSNPAADFREIATKCVACGDNLDFTGSWSDFRCLGAPTDC